LSTHCLYLAYRDLDKLDLLVRKRLKGDGESYRKTIAEMERKIKHLKAEVYDAKEQAEESRKSSGGGMCTECAESAAYVEELKRKMTSLKGQHAAQFEEERKQHQETKNQLVERMANLSELMVENGGFQVDLDSLRSEHGALQAEHADLKLHYESLYSVSPQQYNELAQEKAAVQEALSKAESAVQQILAEKATVVEAFERLKQMNTAIMTATSNLKTEKTELAEKVTLLTAQLAEQAAQFEAQRTADAAEVADEVGRLEMQLALEKQINASSFVSDTVKDIVASTRAISSNASRAAAVASPTKRAAPLKPEGDGYLKTTPSVPSAPTAQYSSVYLSNVLPEVNAIHVLSLIKIYGPVRHVRQLSNTSIVVEYANPDDAQLAVSYLNGKEVEGVTLSCSPYTEPAPRGEQSGTADSTGTMFHALSKITSPKARPHTSKPPPVWERSELQVFVHFHGPVDSVLSADETERELGRYGEIKKFKRIVNCNCYVARYYDIVSRDSALADFPMRERGYRISCEPTFHQLQEAVKRVLAEEGGPDYRIPDAAQSDPGSVVVENNHASTEQPTSELSEHPQSITGFTKLYVSSLLLETNPKQVFDRVKQFGSFVHMTALSTKSFMAQYANPEEASIVMHQLDGMVIEGVSTKCRPYTEPVLKEVSSVANKDATSLEPHSRHATDSAAVVRSPNTQDGTPPKLHQRGIHVMHHAPPKFKMTEDHLRRELSHFGEVKKTKLIATSDSYFAEFFDKSSAEKALQEFPLRVNGFRVTCASDHSLLLRKAAKVQKKIESNLAPAPARPARDESSYGDNKGGLRKLFCTHCNTEGRTHVVFTHNMDRCFYLTKAREKR